MKRHPSHAHTEVPPLSDEDYVERVLALYLSLPHTPNRCRARDRIFAAHLWRDGVPLGVVHRALLLASLRRLCRASDAPALEPVRTLRYFEGAITETLSEPTDAGYFHYLETKLRKLHSDVSRARIKPARVDPPWPHQLRLPF